MATEMPSMPPPPSLVAGAVGAEGRLNAQVSLGGGQAQSVGGGVTALPGNSQDTGDQKDKNGKDELTNAVNQMNDRSELLRRNLKFSIDEGSGQMVIKVVDSQTDEVIRQIPKEEVLAIARSLEKAEGLLFRAKA